MRGDLDDVLADRFEVVGALGRGSFGEVHRVRDRGTGEEFALKVLRDAPDPRRLEREIEAMRRVEHRHVLPLLESWFHEDQAALLLPIAEGSLAERIRDPGRLAETWEHLAQACEGVGALHRAGVVHRDLKPSNLLLVDGAVRVADLGLARGTDLRTLTRTGVIMGTPAYMAPEQARGEPVSPTWDVYALGVMLHEAVRGGLPHRSSAPAELLAEIARGPLLPDLGPRASPEGRVLVASLVDPDAAARPEDLAEVASLLRRHPPGGARSDATRVLDRPGPPPGAGPATLPRSPPPSSGARTRAARPRRSGLRAAAVVLGLAFFFAGMTGGPGDDARAPRPVDSRTPVDSEDAGEAWPGPDWVRRVRDAFSDLRAAPPPRLSVDGLLVPDPRNYGPVLDRNEPLKEFYRWLEAGGDPRELKERNRAALAEVDALYAKFGFPPPIAPFLEVTPLETSQEIVIDRRNKKDERILARPGWLGRALVEMDAARRFWERRLEEYSRILSGDVRPGDPGVLRGGSDETIQEAMIESMQGSLRSRITSLFRDLPTAKARELDRWLLEGTRSYRRALHAATRGAREFDLERDDPEYLVDATNMFRRLTHLSQGLQDTHVGTMKLSQLLGGDPREPLVACFATSHLLSARTHLLLTRAYPHRENPQDVELQLWEVILGESSLPSGIHFRAFLTILMHHISDDQVDLAAVHSVLEARSATLRALPIELRRDIVRTLRARIEQYGTPAQALASGALILKAREVLGNP